jgi:hypothetical protein
VPIARRLKEEGSRAKSGAYVGGGCRWKKNTRAGYITRSRSSLRRDFPNKLTTARSAADAFSAYHEWLSEWLSLCGEDGRRFITDSQKLVDTGVRCLATVSPAMTS